MRKPPFTLLGAAGTAVACAAMVASLPSGVASALGALGIAGSGTLARTVGGAGQPVFIVSAVLLVAGGLACSRLVAALAAAGALLLYLSMFELGRDGASSMSVMGMTHDRGAARADSVTFYGGLAVLLVSIALQVWRRRRRACRPALRLRRASS